MRLYGDVRRLQIREKKDIERETGIEGTERVVRRPAGDNWF